MARRIPRTFAALTLALGVTVSPACDSTPTSSEGTRNPASAEAVAPLPSAAEAGATLPIAVLVRDSLGRPVPAEPVRWEVSEGAGALATVEGVTDPSGVARAEWVLGTRAGPQNVTVRVERVPDLVLRTLVGPGAPAILRVLAGDLQIGVASAVLADSLVAELTDRFGNPVAGDSVHWRVEEGGGSVTPARAVTDTLGRARAIWTLGSTIGRRHHLTATARDSLRARLSATARGTGADGEAPRLEGLTIDPQVVAVDSAGRAAVELHLVDEISGVAEVSISLRSPSGGNRVETTRLERSEGNEVDGVYRGTLVFPRGAESGEWSVEPLRLSDRGGNARSLSGQQLRDRGLTGGVRVLGPQPPRALEPGGSNYLTYSIGAYRDTATEEVWYRPGVLRTVIGSYHEDPAAVRRQMEAMYADGQRKLAFMLWFDDFSRRPELEGRETHGHLVNAAGGRLLPVHRENIRQLLRLMTEVGYTELVFRFAARGEADPREWTEWDEARYLENWSVTVDTKALIDAEVRGGPLRVIYDLEAELGGITHLGQTRAYAIRLWGDWVRRFGTAGTVGFSLIPGPHLFTTANAIYDLAGARPEMYAYDIYGDEFDKLKMVRDEMRIAGEHLKPVIVQEAYYNDFLASEEILRAFGELGLHIRYVMQWPWRRYSGNPHFNVDYPEEFVAYDWVEKAKGR